VGEVKARFAQRYGEAPDLDDFLEGLSECGFIQDVDGVNSAEDVGQDQTPPPNRGWRLMGGVSQESVKWLVSTPVRRLSALLWLAVPVAIVLRPDVAPTPSSAWLPYGVTANLLALTGLSWVLMFLHEVAHLLAVRARGCVAYLQLSHRLHFLVAQTDMTAVRSIPRKDRYAPYLAGMTFDIAVLLAALLLRIAGLGGPLAPTVAFIASVHLLFQFAFFMRTDLYFVICNRFRLGNLMGDTRSWLANRTRAALGRPPLHDLSAVPERELRAVRAYAVVLVTGVIITLGQFVIFGVPVIVRFAGESISAVSAGLDGPGFWDGVVFLTTTALNFGLLLYVIRRDRRVATDRGNHGAR
jgi:hypothetical protein